MKLACDRELLRHVLLIVVPVSHLDVFRLLAGRRLILLVRRRRRRVGRLLGSFSLFLGLPLGLLLGVFFLLGLGGRPGLGKQMIDDLCRQSGDSLRCVQAGVKQAGLLRPSRVRGQGHQRVAPHPIGEVSVEPGRWRDRLLTGRARGRAIGTDGHDDAPPGINHDAAEGWSVRPGAELQVDRAVADIGMSEQLLDHLRDATAEDAFDRADPLVELSGPLPSLRADAGVVGPR